MTKLTFKQYLESKDQLKKAIENVPVSIQEYEVRKYCAMSLGEDEFDVQRVALKPKHKLIVEWRYDDIDNPTPTSIKLVGLADIDDSEPFMTDWNSGKLKKWLVRHATECSPTMYSKTPTP